LTEDPLQINDGLMVDQWQINSQINNRSMADQWLINSGSTRDRWQMDIDGRLIAD
jgi:uncharacterized protein YhdP